jgi:hypothetical protein
MHNIEAWGFLLAQRRDNYLAERRTVDAILKFDDDEGYDMPSRGVPFAQCIRRPDGIVIHAQHLDVAYDIHFREGDPSIGGYTISQGPLAGSGAIFDVKRKDCPSFPDYYYIRVVSTRGNELAWRVAIKKFSRIVEAGELIA